MKIALGIHHKIGIRLLNIPHLLNVSADTCAGLFWPCQQGSIEI
ncbi:hypothetical protein L579_0386 [Pantoea sp. AS-PWVM4]|nr:hypothetical protein L579_0386 [Pantoea sp. AS-PWVM4]